MILRVLGVDRSAGKGVYSLTRHVHIDGIAVWNLRVGVHKPDTSDTLVEAAAAACTAKILYPFPVLGRVRTGCSDRDGEFVPSR